MSLLAVQDLLVDMHSKVLFHGASFGIEAGDHVGLIGANGTGKTTLLRLLVGEAEPDSGNLVRTRGLRIGYLPQESTDAAVGTLLESVLARAPRRADLEERLAAVQHEIDAATDADHQLALAGRISALTHELTDLDRHYAPHHARRILLGLGFQASDFDRPIATFSGGWRMRGSLAGLLFQQPDVLLLDEPTNHLDMPSVHWLDRFLDGFPSALVLVCHDREFLNRHADRIVSLEIDGLRTFRGNYDQYVAQRALELDHLEAKSRRDERKKKDLEAFVERFRAKASKARQAQSKAKLIEKLAAGIPDLPPPRKTVRVRFPEPTRSGDPAAELEGVTFGYGDRLVLDRVDLTVRRADRIAVVGLNGAGKTTLLKLLGGELTPRAGTIGIGHGVTISYFAQHHADRLDPARSVLDEVWSAAPALGQARARGLCGAFLFQGDEVEKPIGVLSGGEKTRVSLAKMLAAPGNFLLLDEPTNHLDTESAEKLTESLEDFGGTIVFVSHDLDFTRRLATKVWDVRDGTVRAWHGSFADYLARLAAEEDAEDAALAMTRRSGVTGAAEHAAGKAARVLERARDKDEQSRLRRERKQAEQRVARLEQDVAALEAEKQELERGLADPAVYQDKLAAADLAARHADVSRRLSSTFDEWERAVAEAERE